MTLTYSTYLIGFEQWFNSNLETISGCFTAEAKELFDTFEDFAVELYFEFKGI